MGVVHIRFEGICTQVKLPRPVAIGEREAHHRVVLVDAEDGPTIVQKKIPPHLAFLAIDQMFIKDVPREITELHCLIPQKDGNWQMRGARLYVENAVDKGLTYLPSSFFYSLTHLAPDFGALSELTVYGNAAACHFDVDSGIFSGVQTPRGSRFTHLEIATTGPEPRLVIEDIIGGGSVTITLAPGATVVVTNTGGKQLGDSADDFLLHYLTAAAMPKDPKPPPDQDTPLPPQANEGLGPGCSNSNYP